MMNPRRHHILRMSFAAGLLFGFTLDQPRANPTPQNSPPVLHQQVAVQENESQKQDALYFASPQEAVPIITELLRKEDWKTLSKYYDLSWTPHIARSELESGRFFVHDKRPEFTHPGLPWKYKHPFAPGFQFDRMKKTGQLYVPVRVILKVEIDEGGGMVQRGFSEFMMRESARGYQVLPPFERFPNVSLSARILTGQALAFVAGQFTNLSVGIRNSVPVTRPIPEPLILLRSVRWADNESGERQWLKRVKGSTTERPDGTVVHDPSARGTTSLCFEHGLIFTGEELSVNLPLTPRPDGRHDLLVSFEVVSGGPILLPEKFMTSSKEPTIFYPVASERGERIMRARRSAGEWAIVGGTNSCSAPVGQIYTVRLPLQLPVVADTKSDETGGISREKAAELAGVALELEKYRDLNVDGLKRITRHDFKSKRPAPGKRNTYLRFHLSVYEYQSPESAASAFDRLRREVAEEQDEVPYKAPLYVLLHGDKVYWLSGACLYSRANWDAIEAKLQKALLGQTESGGDQAIKILCGGALAVG